MKSPKEKSITRESVERLPGISKFRNVVGKVAEETEKNQPVNWEENQFGSQIEVRFQGRSDHCALNRP